jgi:hypothetical protein
MLSYPPQSSSQQSTSTARRSPRQICDYCTNILVSVLLVDITQSFLTVKAFVIAPHSKQLQQQHQQQQRPILDAGKFIPQEQRIRMVSIEMKKDNDSNPNDDIAMGLSREYMDDNDDLVGDDDEKDDMLDTIDWDNVDDEEEEGEEDYDDLDGYNDNSNDNVDADATTILSDDSDDASVNDIFQEWTNVQEETRARSQQRPKNAIVHQFFNEMTRWNTLQYNQLLRQISQGGWIRDAEAILYRMIQQQQGGEPPSYCATVDDETFYHVFAAYSYRQQKRPSKNNNNRKWGAAFKVEQLLAIQDALCDKVKQNPSPSDHPIVEPSIRTLNAALNAMALDRTDTRVALRARRIWDRLMILTDDDMDEPSRQRLMTNSVVAVLKACTHVPRRTATAKDKLSAFMVALDCFNWATTTTITLPEAIVDRRQSTVYMWFLKACRILLSETVESKRDSVIEAAFRRCCTAGYVNSKVLQAFEEVASDTLMLRVLGGFIEDGQEPPIEWSRNCAITKMDSVAT